MVSIRDQSSGTITGGVFAFMTPGWRARLREASFKGAAFHTEQQARLSGRRTVVHEYPKRDEPFAEDLGRAAIRYQITGYVIQKMKVRNEQRGFRYKGITLLPEPGRDDSNFASKEYDVCRDQLIQALESWGPGLLVDPYDNRIGPYLFQCERYTVVESRERGGYAQFDMSFVEAGLSAFQNLPDDSETKNRLAADKATLAAAEQMDRLQRGAVSGVAPAVPGVTPPGAFGEE